MNAGGDESDMDRYLGERGQPVTCGNCGDDDCLHLYVQLKENEVVSFFSCHTCHAEWWKRHGVTVDLTEVLAMADL